ncbi:MAG: putative toxin-antitoxin system toxin component, PIN family [Acidobacteriota bacterium]|nr:putative toxin-antitoxin system toxin component, PIN family [Acidobacteriota bacterium]
MNVLVDTNVVISAVIRDRLPQRVIDEIVSRDDWFWIVTTEIETEYREVLARPKFKVPTAIQQSWRAFLEEVTIRVQPTTPPPFPRDPKDELFIAAALASDADYLITGDKDLLDEQPLISTQILRPAEFARLFAIA